MFVFYQSPSLPVEVTSKSVDPQSVTLSVVAPIYPGQLIHLTVWAENKVISWSFQLRFRVIDNNNNNQWYDDINRYVHAFLSTPPSPCVIWCLPIIPPNQVTRTSAGCALMIGLNKLLYFLYNRI